MPATRHLYLARHAEAGHENGSLTARGRDQAVALGRRLRHAGVDSLHHGPLARATQTARLVAGESGTAPVRAPEAGDYAPHLPLRAELPQEHADGVLGFVASLPEHERLRGPALARRALERFTGPVEGEHERHEAVITHAYLVGWIVCVALDAPAWRWTTLAPANAALTVLRYSPDRPASVLASNDTAHLD